MDYAEEDAIIAQAKAIESKAFDDAETRWAALPDDANKRPWPRCGSLQCNRTLVCVHASGQRCQGFDF